MQLIIWGEKNLFGYMGAYLRIKIYNDCIYIKIDFKNNINFDHIIF